MNMKLFFAIDRFKGFIAEGVTLLANPLKEQRGDWLGSVAWLAIYALAAIVVAAALVTAITALQARVVTDIGTINP